MASGLLVLLLNDANRYASGIMGSDRAWTGEIRLGVSTDTHDINGRVLAQNAVQTAPDADSLEKASREFKGDIFQCESRFSAIRKEISSPYEIADTGEHKPFLAHVFGFSVAPAENGADPSVLRFSLEGTKGVIPRTLVDSFGKQLGCGAALSALTRTRIGRFDLSSAIPFDRLMRMELHSFPSAVMPLSVMRR